MLVITTLFGLAVSILVFVALMSIWSSVGKIEKAVEEIRRSVSGNK